MLLSCKICNEDYKKNHFPLRTACRARVPGDPIRRELPVLIDPVSEDPEQFLKYKWVLGRVPLAKPEGLDRENRGADTIATLGLDRDELNTERGNKMIYLEAIASLLSLADKHNDRAARLKAIRAIKKLTKAKSEFCGLNRYYFHAKGHGNLVSPR